MRRFSVLGWLMTVCAVILIVAMPGCIKRDNPEEDFFDDDFGGETIPPVVLDVPLDGKISGTVTYDGNLPPMKIDQSHYKTDRHCCIDDPMMNEFEKIYQTWIIDKSNKTVANVLIVLKPSAKNTIFELKKEDLSKWIEEKVHPQTVVMDQPHCAFVPHVVSLFPYYKKNDNSQERTAQNFVVTNTSGCKHNTKISGALAAYENSDSNRTLPSGEEGKKGTTIFVKPQPSPFSVSCQIHPQMSAKIWAFDHPYHKVTGQDGKYALYHVPTGVDLEVMVWHEADVTVKSADGTTFKFDAPSRFHIARMQFKKGDNALDLKISAK